MTVQEISQNFLSISCQVVYANIISHQLTEENVSETGRNHEQLDWPVTTRRSVICHLTCRIE